MAPPLRGNCRLLDRRRRQLRLLRLALAVWQEVVRLGDGFRGVCIVACVPDPLGFRQVVGGVEGIGDG